MHGKLGQPRRSALRRLRLLTPLAVIGTAAALCLPTIASACPCSEFCGRVLAHGSSAYGVPWTIKASLEPPRPEQRAFAQFHFSSGACGTYRNGYFKGLRLPIHPRFAFSALQGFGEHPEADLSGVTHARVRTLIARLDDGSLLEIHPFSAPPSLRERWPWLRRVRVFDHYYPGAARVVELTACDAGDRPIARTATRKHLPLAALAAQGLGQRAQGFCESRASDAVS
jgi:hypothetical protein